MQEKVRNKAFELRKVKGEVNPADIFTKYLLTRDRIEQLMTLFNCEYRSGRADAAPKLRKANLTAPKAQNDPEEEEVHALEGEDEDDPYASQVAHDPSTLPHNYLPDDLDELFPRAVAPEEDGGDRDLEEKVVDGTLLARINPSTIMAAPIPTTLSLQLHLRRLLLLGLRRLLGVGLWLPECVWRGLPLWALQVRERVLRY